MALISGIGLLLLLVLAPVQQTEPPAKGESGQRTSGIDHNAELRKTFWQRTTDDPITSYTLALVIFTAVLACVSVVQIRYLRRADDTARRASQAAIVAANAASLQATAAVNVERPFVVLSDIRLSERSPGAFLVEYVFTNYGRTPAFVRQVRAFHKVAVELPDEPVYATAGILTAELVIKPGESHTEVPPVILHLPDGANSGHQEFEWFWGSIRYRDFVGGIAETGFIAMRYPGIVVAGGIQLQEPTIRLGGGPAKYTYERYEPAPESKLT